MRVKKCKNYAKMVMVGTYDILVKDESDIRDSIGLVTDVDAVL